MATFEESFLYPLILLLVGAGVSGVLVAWLTNRWEIQRKDREMKMEDQRKAREFEVEDHRKELEIKVDIVSKMAEYIAYQVANSETSRLRKKKTFTDADKDAFDEERTKTRVDTEIITTKLESYFPKTDVFVKWHEYSLILMGYRFASQLFFLEAPNQEQENRLKFNLEVIVGYLSDNRRKKIHDFVDKRDITSDLDRLVTEGTYDEDLWISVIVLLQQRGREIIKDVSKLRIKVFE